MTASDQFYARNKGQTFVNVTVNWPAEVYVTIEDHDLSSPLRIALVRIGGLTIRHDAIDMRLLLMAALEQLNEVEQLDRVKAEDSE